MLTPEYFSKYRVSTKSLRGNTWRLYFLNHYTYWSLTLREEHRLRVFENRVLRGIFGPKRDEVTGKWRKLHSEELHNLYSSPDIIRQVKSRRMRWAGHVARRRECTRFWWESPKERDHLKDQVVCGKMGSEWILERLAWGYGLDSACSGQGPVAGCCECGDEPSGSCATEFVLRGVEKFLYREVCQIVGYAPRGILYILWGGRVVCVSSIFLLNEIWTKFQIKYVRRELCFV
jgi:hypothetical protein